MLIQEHPSRMWARNPYTSLEILPTWELTVFIPDKKSFKKFESYIKCVKCVRKIGDQYECDGIKLIITLVEMKYPDLGNLCQNIYEAIDIGMIGDFDKVSTFIEIGGKLKEIVSNPITKKIIGVDQKK